jgi:hypothetical protein
MLSRRLFPLLLMVGLLMTSASSHRGLGLTGTDLTRVQITWFAFGSPAPETLYVIDSRAVVKTLYQAAWDLPTFYADACTLQGGPGYELTFWQGGKAVETATADESGCGEVTFRGGEKRQPDQAFWQLLHQVIAQAPAVKQPERPGA